MHHDQIQVGDIIHYKLLPKDRPTNPDQEWKGRVKNIDVQSGYVLVEVLDPGFAGQEEYITLGQIVRVER